jgi:hypothetical protein
MLGKIHKVPNGITWEEFQEKYLRFFPNSHAPSRLADMAEEFERLTGRNPFLKVKRTYAARKPKQEENQAPPLD